MLTKDVDVDALEKVLRDNLYICAATELGVANMIKARGNREAKGGDEEPSATRSAKRSRKEKGCETVMY